MGLRSFLPFTLPGVLALMGWWWYLSRKKAHNANHKTEAGAAVGLPEKRSLPASSSEGSNGIMENSCSWETSSVSRTAQERKTQKLKEMDRNGVEQEVVVEIHVPVAASSMAEMQGQAQCVETVGKANAALSLCSSLVAEFDTSTEDDPAGSVSKESTNASHTCRPSVHHLSKTVEESVSPKGPEEAEVSSVTSKLLHEGTQAATAFVSGLGKQAAKQKEVSEVNVALASISQIEEIKISSTAELTEAVRPEPEGEVAADRIIVPFAEKLQLEAAKETLPSKDDLPALPADSECSPRSSHQEPLCPEITAIVPSSCHVTSTHAPLPTPVVEGAPESGRHIKCQENGLPGAFEERGENLDEIKLLAAGLITEVISAAAQLVSRCDDVGKGPCCPGEQGDRTGQEHRDMGGAMLANGRPCTVRDQAKRDDLDIQTCREIQHLAKEGPAASAPLASEGDAKENQMRAQVLAVNGCLTPPSMEVMRIANSVQKGDCLVRVESKREAVPQNLAKLQAEEATVGAEDSGCSTCQSEDGISSEDLLQSTGLSCTLPESKEDLFNVSMIEGASEGQGAGASAEQSLEASVLPEHRTTPCGSKGLNGAPLRNGSQWASETEVDQSGGSDVNSMDSVDSGCTLGAGEISRCAGQATHPQKPELTIWEIEVPKHLVGRLIGKQGRYVSFLKQSSGAKIYISTLPYTQEFQICHIEGTQQQVDKALGLIGKKFKDLDLANLYAPPPLTLPSLPMTSWLLLPSGVTVEVVVVNIVSAGHMFVQQHTHPTYHALRSLDQQMFLCYSQPGAPALPTPVEAGVICAAPALEGSWWRAQVIAFYKESSEVEIRYVDYGGYDRVKVDLLRQIRSDFVTLPFQGAEVLLDNVAPLPGEDRFSMGAESALEEMTGSAALLAQVTNYDNHTGLPYIQLWNMVGEELVSVNRALAERGVVTWVDSF
ncbi:AKAP1 protein, partial [Amia calva]|nr:AKAP1 protein [Amia calva]